MSRNLEQNGAWDYATNAEVLDKFFREGIERAKNNEDLITIGMRGDGDAAMGGKEGHDDEFVRNDEYYIKLYEKIFENQRRIIKEVTGKPAEQRPQMWAIYKEMQHYYDLGLRVPDDVLIMLCDDNWGNIRCVPGSSPEGMTSFDKKLTARKGGWGMYYHVDYVGAPRNTKWANVTPVAHLWEQMNLCHQYGIDRLWVLNVGDLKPQEYPIDLFLSMAWNPDKYAKVGSYKQHTLEFCEAAFGKDHAAATARLFEKYLTYNGRVTPEMLTSKTYNLASGEFLQVMNEYKALEADALNEYNSLAPEFKDAFFQLLLYPIQSMANLYEMYYAHAQNQFCYVNGLAEANDWADVVAATYARDQKLTDGYHALNGGKWNHLMDQTHIGYVIWQEPRQNTMPHVNRLAPEQVNESGFVFSSKNGFIAMEAEHYYSKTNADSGAEWNNLPQYGRTKSAMALMPYTSATAGASVSYKFELPKDIKDLKVHVITNSTLPYLRTKGHRYTVSIDGGTPVEVNYNGLYTEENPYLTFDVVATRIIETVTELKADGKEGSHTLTIAPIEPGMVLEKIVVDYGGYEPQHLFGTESTFKNEKQNEWKVPERRFPPRN